MVDLLRGLLNVFSLRCDVQMGCVPRWEFGNVTNHTQVRMLLLLNKVGNLMDRTEGGLRDTRLSTGIIKEKDLRTVFIYKRYLFVFIINKCFVLSATFVAEHSVQFIR